MEMRWILGIWLLVNSSSAVAQETLCGERGEILRGLENKYGEVVEHSAVANNGTFVEWTVAPDGGWSMLVTTSDGKTCLVWWGDGWSDKRKMRGIRI